MFDLEREMHRWRRELGRGGDLEDGDIAELEAHVRDEIRGHVEAGLDEAAAFRKATSDPRDEALGCEYVKVRRPARLGSGLAWSAAKVGFRKMRRQKGYSFINIVGLALGMACCLLILFWVRDEMSYDRFHAGAERIYRINKRYPLGAKTETNTRTPYPLNAAIRSSLPEAEESTVFFSDSALVRYQDKIFTERGLCNTDASFFRVFSLPFLRGSAAAMDRPDGAVITARTARRYFGDQDPIGKMLILDGSRLAAVAGVIADPPANSLLRYDIFLPVDPAGRDSWRSHYCFTFVRLREGADPRRLEARLSTLMKERLPEEKIELILQPLTKIRLYAPDGSPAGMKYVRFFSLIAFFILAIACINFINLSTARSEKRAREVGLRKAVGARRGQLIRQFLAESTLTTGTALAAAFGLVLARQAPFTALTGKSMAFLSLGGSLLGGLAAVALLTGILAGAYPALVLSSFQPALVLRGVRARRPAGTALRKVLVVLQFALAAVLIIGTGVIARQIRFLRRADPGYRSAGVAYLKMNDRIAESYEALRDRVRGIPDILGLARCSELPGEVWSITRGIRWDGSSSTEGAAFGFLSVDRDFLDLMGIELLQGRNFRGEAAAEQASVIVNQNAARLMSPSQALGRWLGRESKSAATVIGVVRDFHSLPYQNAIEPVAIYLDPSSFGFILIRLRPGADAAKAMSRVAAAWKATAPDFPFEYRFLDDRFGLQYRDELRAEKLFSSFVVLAVFISCLGLFGLASFTAERRTKEIGIRKILGASAVEVAALLIRDYMKWIALANLIAWPAAFLIMKSWLRQFAYRAEPGLTLFLAATALSLAIALLTVGFQSLKAARADPAISLRYE